jgi:hypothetical protein
MKRLALPVVVSLLGALAGGGCSEEDARFPVVVTAETDDGQPLADLPVTVGKTPAGRTDATGHLKMRVVGKEGARVVVSVPTPKGYRAVSTSNAVVLRRLGNIDSSGGHPLPIEHVVKFAPLQRQYAVLVRAGIPGIPVETFGTKQAVTNEKGVASFLYEGTPGDELQVKLVTDGRPDLLPHSPTQSFLLATRAEAYLVKEHFTPIKKAVHKKPGHSGPKRL